jgi:hypothetical protein
MDYDAAGDCFDLAASSSFSTVHILLARLD